MGNVSYNHNHLLSTILGQRGEINEENKGRRRVSEVSDGSGGDGGGLSASYQISA